MRTRSPAKLDVEKVKVKLIKAEAAFDRAVDAGEPREVLRRREKAMNKAQLAYRRHAGK